MTRPTPSQVMSPTPTTSRRLTSSPTQSSWPRSRSSPRQGFPEDAEYDDAALEDMLREAHRVHVHHSQREDLSVGQSSSVSERTGRPVGERAGRPAESSSQDAQIRNLLDRQNERILAECQAEIDRHEFQADHDPRSLRKLGEIVESQREELHCAQAEELQRQDQQLLHGQLLQQNLELREAHQKSLCEIGRIKEVSEFHLRHYCKTKISRGSGHYFGTFWPNTGFAKWNKLYEWFKRVSGCWINSQWEIPTLPVDKCHSHLIQFLKEC